MRLVAYSTLETAARSQGDLLSAPNPSSSEYMQWVNDEWAEIYDQLVMSGEKYFMKTGTGTTVAAQADYALPVDFYKLRGVDVQVSAADATRWVNAHRGNMERRNDYPSTSWNWPGTVYYDIWGTALVAAAGTLTPPNLHFITTPQGAYNFRFYYFQPAVVLTSTTDQIDLENGHEKALTFAVCARAALKLRQLEFAQAMVAERDKQLERIISNLRDLDVGEPKVARIVRGKPAWRKFGRGLRWWDLP